MEKLDMVEIGRSIGCNPEHLKPVVIEVMPDLETYDFSDALLPTFCYDNAALAASNLFDVDCIVYGAAKSYLGEEFSITCEHCWIKLRGGVYVDPTYQMMQSFKCEYFSLIEIPMREYIDLNHFYPYSGMDFLALRMMDKYKHILRHRSNE